MQSSTLTGHTQVLTLGGTQRFRVSLLVSSRQPLLSMQLNTDCLFHFATVFTSFNLIFLGST